MEQKLINMLDKMKQDERQGLERERRLMEQVQDGLNTMNEIIKGTKEQTSVNMNHQTTLIGEQIGSQSQALEEVKSYVFGRQGVIEEMMRSERADLLAELDLDETSAYATRCEGNFGSLRLNQIGREPRGCVCLLYTSPSPRD